MGDEAMEVVMEFGWVVDLDLRRKNVLLFFEGSIGGVFLKLFGMEDEDGISGERAGLSSDVCMCIRRALSTESFRNLASLILSARE